MKIKIIISLLLCFSTQAMESDLPKNEEVKTIFARTPFALYLTHAVAQAIATHILKDKALELIKECPFSLELPSNKEDVIPAAFTYFLKIIPRELIQKVALMLSFHILFSKAPFAQKISLLSLVIPYLSPLQQGMFTHIQKHILCTIPIHHPDAVLPIPELEFTTTLLHLAVTIRDKDSIQALLSFNSTIDIQDSLGYTALHYAIGCPEVLKVLLEYGAKCSIADKAGSYPIEDALSKGDLESIELLLQKTALTKDKKLVSKIAYYSSFITEPEIPSLIERTFKEYGVYDELPFSLKVYLAIAAHNSDLFKLFDDSYHEPDAFSTLPTGDTFLHLAIRCNNTQAVLYFLKNSADPHKVNSYGLTPLHDAAAIINKEIMIELLKRGACVDIRGFRNYTPLHWAAVNGTTEMISLLLEYDASLEALTDSQETPLYLSVIHGREKAVQLLIEKHACIDATDQEGYSILMRALQGINNISCIKLLVQAGAQLTFTQLERLRLTKNACKIDIIQDIILKTLKACTEEQRLLLLDKAIKDQNNELVTFISLDFPQLMEKYMQVKSLL